MSGPYLKSRDRVPPNGFQYLQVQTGWKSWDANPNTASDFNLLCQLLQQHRLANPQYKLPTDLTAIQNEVDTVNALRCLGMRGGDYYVQEGVAAPFQPALSAITDKLRAAVEGVKKVSSGAAVLLDWEESGDPPVSSEVSASRAEICATCPKNGKGDFTHYFTIPLSQLIRTSLNRLADLNLSTPSDDKINVCEACLCPLKLKVHTPMKHILEHTSGEVKAELDPRCWILKG